MKLALAVAALFLFSIPAGADQIIDYAFSAQNAPGGIGDFSWEIQTEGFIQPLPVLLSDSNHNCLNCNSNYFDSFISLSAPSKGDGCGITKLYLVPDYALTTFFSPLCDGLYDSFTGGGLPQPGMLGTWSWQGTSPDGSQNFETLTISDPPAAPEQQRGEPGDPVAEPATLGLLASGLLGLAAIRRRDP